MGACLSQEDSAEMKKKKRSRAIDATLEEDNKRLKRECKILLLGRTESLGVGRMICYLFADHAIGSGESGKSTIVKQMKIIHQKGYTKDELALYRLTVYKNIIDCAKALIGAMQQFDIEPGDPQNQLFCEFLLDYQVSSDPHTPLDPQVGEAIVSVWKDPSISLVMDRQSEFYLMDSAP